MKFRHVIFDCDGVLVDSEPLSMRADVAILKRFGIVMTEVEAHRRFVGKTFEAMLVEMTAELGVDFPPGLQQVKNKMLAEMYERELCIVDGAMDLLEDLKRRKISCSVASNSPAARVALALRLTAIETYFGAITSFEDVASGKPAPDVFLRAAEIADFEPQACVVIEDSVTGVMAGVAAGMRTIGFTGTHHEPEVQGQLLTNKGAFAVVNCLKEVIHHLA